MNARLLFLQEQQGDARTAASLTGQASQRGTEPPRPQLRTTAAGPGALRKGRAGHTRPGPPHPLLLLLLPIPSLPSAVAQPRSAGRGSRGSRRSRPARRGPSPPRGRAGPGAPGRAGQGARRLRGGGCGCRAQDAVGGGPGGAALLRGGPEPQPQPVAGLVRGARGAAARLLWGRDRRLPAVGRRRHHGGAGLRLLVEEDAVPDGRSPAGRRRVPAPRAAGHTVRLRGCGGCEPRALPAGPGAARSRLHLRGQVGEGRRVGISPSPCFCHLPSFPPPFALCSSAGGGSAASPALSPTGGPGWALSLPPDPVCNQNLQQNP